MSENIPTHNAVPVDLETATIFLRPDGIVQINTKEISEMTLKDFTEIVDAIGIVGGGKKYPVLSIAGGNIQIEKEALKFSAGEEGSRYALADAFVLNSFALKLIGNIYIKINLPIKPTKMFTNSDYAVKWLSSYIE